MSGHSEEMDSVIPLEEAFTIEDILKACNEAGVSIG